MPRCDKFRWKISHEKHKKILKLLRAGVGKKKIASIVGVGVKTVQLRVGYLQIGAEDLADNEAGFVSRSMVCPVHGAIEVSPCVACAAIAERVIKIDPRIVDGQI